MRWAERLGCQRYYSDSGDEAAKAAALAGWIAGRPSVVMVATSAFALGIDYAHMRLVVHLGPPRSAIDFAQEAGRLGRDGDGGISLTYLPRGLQTRRRNLPLLKRMRPQPFESRRQPISQRLC